MLQEPQIRVTRSRRRQRTVAARLVDDGAVLEILAPAAMPEDVLGPIVDRLKARVLRQQQREKHADDGTLARRAGELNRQYFGGKLRWHEIRYVTNQQRRYGSCTPATGTIRISHRLATLPGWVQDYVIVHELAHLVEANHGGRFWKLVNRFPRAERARGYLMALGLEEQDEEPLADDVESEPVR